MGPCCATCELADVLACDPLDLVVANPEIPWTFSGGRPALELRLGQIVRAPDGRELELVPTLGASVDASAQINASLSAAGLSTDQVQAAVSAYTGLDAGAQAAIVGLLGGGEASLTSLAPLLGSALAISGVGAPVVAAVAAALPVLDAIAGALYPSTTECKWKVNSVCFNQTRPWGPTDPLWTSWATFVSYASVKPAFGPDMLDSAFPQYEQTMAAELGQIAALPAPTLEQTFRRTYYLAWQKNQEYKVNGYTAADDYALLEAVAKAWNALHDSSQTVTYAPGDSSYIARLLGGLEDGTRHAPVVVNVGTAPSWAAWVVGAAFKTGLPPADLKAEGIPTEVWNTIPSDVQSELQAQGYTSTALLAAVVVFSTMQASGLTAAQVQAGGIPAPRWNAVGPRVQAELSAAGYHVQGAAGGTGLSTGAKVAIGTAAAASLAAILWLAIGKPMTFEAFNRGLRHAFGHA